MPAPAYTTNEQALMVELYHSIQGNNKWVQASPFFIKRTAGSLQAKYSRAKLNIINPGIFGVSLDELKAAVLAGDQANFFIAKWLLHTPAATATPAQQGAAAQTAGPVAAAAPQTISSAPQIAVQAAVGPATGSTVNAAPASGPVAAAASQTSSTAPQNAVQTAAAVPPPAPTVATQVDAPAFSTRGARARRVGTAPPAAASSTVAVQHDAPVRPSLVALGKRRATTIEPEDVDEPVRPAKVRKTVKFAQDVRPTNDNITVQPRDQPAGSVENAADALLSAAGGADSGGEENEAPIDTEPVTWANANAAEQNAIAVLAAMKMQKKINKWVVRGILNGDIQFG